MLANAQTRRLLIKLGCLLLLGCMIVVFLYHNPTKEPLEIDFSMPAKPLVSLHPEEPVIVMQTQQEVQEQVTAEWQQFAPQAVEKGMTADDAIDASPYLSGWAVQLESFSAKNDAEQMIEKLIQAGFSAFSRQVSAKQQVSFVVYLGPKLDRVQAERLLVALRQHPEFETVQGYVVLLPE